MKTVRIFISSPGDVAEEREKARRVVERLEARYAGQAHLKPVLWEELPLQVDMSFQQGIDLVLSKEHGIDIAVFILWSRLGSPTGPMIRKPDGTEYRSGTEREFDLMLRAREQSQGDGKSARPAILAYARSDNDSFQDRLRMQSEDTSKLRDTIEQRALAEGFIREEFHDDKGRNLRAYHSYRRPPEFTSRLRAHLIGLLDELLGMEEMGEPWVGAPYVGLEAFEFEQERIFRGREREVCELNERLRAQAEKGCAFVLVLGASGSGKSSLARAGLMPAICLHDLDEEVTQWRRAVLRRSQEGGGLLQRLVRALMEDHALPELRNAAGDGFKQLATDLARDAELTVRHVIVRCFEEADKRAGGTVRLIILLDQLEEAFTGTTTPEAREEFFGVIEQLACSGRVWVVATARSDFYAQIQASLALLRMKEGQGQYDLLPVSEEALRRIIVDPARIAGLQFESADNGQPRLEERIFTDALRHPEALPHIQYLLRELYEMRRGNTLTATAYEELGGVAGVLGRRAEAVMSGVGAEAQATFDSTMRALVTVQTEGQIRATRRNAILDSIRGTEPQARLVNALVEARLLTTDRDEQGRATVAVAHEALLRSWPRLSEWIEANRSFLKVRSRVEADAKEWTEAAENKKASYLMPEGLRLAEAKDLLKRFPTDLGEADKSFIGRSVDAAEARQRVDLTRLRRRNMILTVAAALAVIGAAVAAWKWKEADQSARKAKEKTTQAFLSEGRAHDATIAADKARFDANTERDRVKNQQVDLLISSAEEHLRNGRRRPGLLLLTEALRLDPSHKAARAAFLNHLAYDKMAPAAVRFPIPAGNSEIVFSADGRVAFIWAGSTGEIVDVETGKQIGNDLEQTFPISEAHFLQNGRQLLTHGVVSDATIGYGGFVYWDLSVSPAASRYVNVTGDFAVDEENQRAIVIGYSELGPGDATEYPLMDIGSKTGKPVPAWSDFGEKNIAKGNMLSFELSPTGKWAIYDDNKLLRYPDGKGVIDLSGADCHAFSADGNKFLMIKQNQLIVLTAGGKTAPAKFKLPLAEYKTVDCSSDCTLIATEDTNHRVALWGLTGNGTVAPKGFVFVGNKSWVLADDARIYTWSESGLLYYCDFSRPFLPGEEPENREVQPQLVYDGGEISTIGPVPHKSGIAVLWKTGLAAFFPTETFERASNGVLYGNSAISGPATFDAKGGRLAIWKNASWCLIDALSGNLLAQSNTKGSPIGSITLNADGSYALDAGKLWRYDPRTGTLNSIDLPPTTEGYGNEWSFSEDGKRLLLKSRTDGPIVEHPDGTSEREPGGTLLAAFEVGGMACKIRATIPAERDSAAFDENEMSERFTWDLFGSTLLHTRRDGLVELRSGDNGEVVWKAQFKGKEFEEAVLLSNDVLLFSQRNHNGKGPQTDPGEVEYSFGQIFLVETSVHEPPKSIILPETIETLSMSPDHSSLAAVSNTSVYLFTVPELSLTGGLNVTAHSATFSTDSESLVVYTRSAKYDRYMGKAPNGVELYDRKALLPLGHLWFEPDVVAASTAPDMRSVRVVRGNGELLRFDLAPGGSESITPNFYEFIKAYTGMSIKNVKPQEELGSVQKLHEIGDRIRSDPPSSYKDVALWLLESSDKRAPNPFAR